MPPCAPGKQNQLYFRIHLVNTKAHKGAAGLLTFDALFQCWSLDRKVKNRALISILHSPKNAFEQKQLFTALVSVQQRWIFHTLVPVLETHHCWWNKCSFVNERHRVVISDRNRLDIRCLSLLIESESSFICCTRGENASISRQQTTNQLLPTKIALSRRVWY